MNRTFYITLIMSLVVVTQSGVVAASSDHERARELSASGAIVPLGKITSQLRERRIDHILEVELESNDAGHYYEIEALDDQGRVRKLKYDATTGRFLSEHDDD